MNKYLKITALLIITAMTAPALFAQAPTDAGTSASAFLKIPYGSPRAQALGNAYVSLAEGADSLFWNPAGASVVENKTVHVGYLQWIGDYNARTLAYLQPMGKTIVAVSGTYMDVSGPATDGSGIPLGEWDVRNYVLTVSLARGFFSNVLQLGGTFKYINENNGGTHGESDMHYNNIGFDVGGKLDFKRVGIGVAAINLGDSDEMPSAVRGGAHLKTRYYTLVGEVIKYVDYKLQFGAGLEIHIPEDLLQVARFDLRAGYYSRDSAGINTDNNWISRVGLDRSTQVSFGFGLYSDELFGYGAGLDFACTPFGALGTVYNLAVGIQF